MKPLPTITESEWKIMRVLWTQSPASSSEVVEALGTSASWHPNTVKTLLSRLHQKKAIGVRKSKNLFLYSPLVTEEECTHLETTQFLGRVFGGSVKPLLLYLARRRKISLQDLEEAREFLARSK